MMLVVFTIFGLTMNAQNFKLGINAGLPVGDADNVSSFSLILDANYLWEVAESFDAGIMASFSHSFGKEEKVAGMTYNYDDISYLPIGAAGRFNASDRFTIGLDLGYAIGVSKNIDGGFYYAPKVQYGISDGMDLVAAYRGVSANGGSFNIFSLGLEFNL